MKNKTKYEPLPKSGYLVIDAGLKIKISQIAYKHDLPAIVEIERLGKKKVVPGQGLYGGTPSYTKSFRFVD